MLVFEVGCDGAVMVHVTERRSCSYMGLVSSYLICKR